MRRVKVFITYFPVILLSCQVAVNLMYFIVPNFYFSTSFYLNLFAGTNILVAIFLVLFTFTFKFCQVSRWAAAAQFLFAAFYLIIKEDNIYNICFQVSVGAGALILTFRTYIKKFPLCRMSLLATFLSSILETGGNCKKAADIFEEKLTATVYKNESKY